MARAVSELSPEAPFSVRRPRTQGWRMPEKTVHVGRPTRWATRTLEAHTRRWLSTTLRAYTADSWGSRLQTCFTSWPGGTWRAGASTHDHATQTYYWRLNHLQFGSH